MNNNYTLLINPIVDGIFTLLKSINLGVMTLMFLGVIVWYGYQINYATKAIDTIYQEYGIELSNSRYIISNVCEDVMVDATTLEIVAQKNKNAYICISF